MNEHLKEPVLLSTKEPVPLGSVTQTVDVTTATQQVIPPPPWLSKQLRNLLLGAITLTVIYLAYIGEEQARQSLYAAFTVLAGMLFGERAALRSPSTTPEK